MRQHLKRSAKNMGSVSKLGFTLIELMVVMAVVSVLASTIFTTVNSARAKARDAKRLDLVDQLRVALELYYNDNNSFPYTTDNNGWFDASGCMGGAVADLPLTSPYLVALAKDPLCTTDQYFLGYQTKNNGQGYIIVFMPETSRALANSMGCYLAGYYCYGFNHL